MVKQLSTVSDAVIHNEFMLGMDYLDLVKQSFGASLWTDLGAKEQDIDLWTAAKEP